jgi:hypothetical protein
MKPPTCGSTVFEIGRLLHCDKPAVTFYISSNQRFVAARCENHMITVPGWHRITFDLYAVAFVMSA